jgi:predicted Zn-dependent protease with MMP-like domain
MFTIDQTAFEKLVAEAIDAIPDKYYQHINNVVFVTEDEPSPEQRYKLKLRHDQSLFGLYEGIPIIRRSSGYNMVLPDKITIFKKPLEWAANNLEELRGQVHKTVWHEVAHYYGLDHLQIHELEN